MRLINGFWRVVRTLVSLLMGWTLGWVLIGLVGSAVLVGIACVCGVVPQTTMALGLAIPVVYVGWRYAIKPMLILWLT